MFSNLRVNVLLFGNCSMKCNHAAPTTIKYLQLLLLVAFISFCSLGLCSCKKQTVGHQAQNITVVSYGGGAYQQSHKTAFCEPFSEITGVNIDSVVWNADYGKLKVMVQSGNVPWDVVEVTAAQFARGIKENLFSKLSVLPHEGDFLPNTVDNFGVANVYWGTVMAFRKNAFTNDNPASWKDFWDVQRFPGNRALYDDPRGNLEFALLADGVTKEHLYPLDIDRAFKKLDEIKPYVRVWWTDGTQPVQMLINGTVVLSSVWNGRIYASEEARSNLAYSWQGAGLELDYWVVPKGSKHVDVASRFILFASLPYTLARQTEIVGYGPVNTNALKLVSESARPHLPTFNPNWDASFVVNAEWWSENEETVKTRWLNWKAK